ncbi:8-oxo-dGTP diphosphatase [Spathaspora sp. JA1]|nr:8-oxo-dGTP diphosphatase [Spathaspora sp. JA1]
MTSDPRLKYTLGFIYCPENKKVLLLNRNKSPWMGKWNGVGGKLESGETPLQCIQRETLEETGLSITNYQGRGILTWEVTDDKGSEIGGLYLFTGEISLEQYNNFKTPVIFSREGILDWKDWDWIIHENNLGVVDNIKLLFKTLLSSNEKDLYTVKYHNNQLISWICYPGQNLKYPF